MESDEDEEEDDANKSVKADFEEVQKNKRLDKKRRLKERFDAEYDDGDATYFDDLKEEMQKQAEVLLWAFWSDADYSLTTWFCEFSCDILSKGKRRCIGSFVRFNVLRKCFSFLSPQLNRAEFEDVDDETRVLYEGFRPGMYIRLEISSIPCEFVTNFDPHYPIILGGLTSSEGNVGYLQVWLFCCKAVWKISVLWWFVSSY